MVTETLKKHQGRRRHKAAQDAMERFYQSREGDSEGIAGDFAPGPDCPIEHSAQAFWDFDGTYGQAVCVLRRGSTVKLALPSPVKGTRKRGGKRMGITGFSKASRRRLLHKLWQYDWERVSRCIHLVLTFPQKGGIIDVEVAHQARRAMIKRLNRLSDKPNFFVWKLESHEKTLAPHFHVLCLDVPFVQKNKLRQMWREVLASLNVEGADKAIQPFVRWEKNGERILNYLAKYCAKEGEWNGGGGEGPKGGSSSGGGNSVDTRAEGAGGEAATPSLERVTYPATDEKTWFNGHRAWGVEFRENAPLVKVERMALPAGAWYARMRRVQRKFVQSKFREEAKRMREKYGVSKERKVSHNLKCQVNKGFTVLTKTPEQWLKLALMCFENEIDGHEAAIARGKSTERVELVF